MDPSLADPAARPTGAPVRRAEARGAGTRGARAPGPWLCRTLRRSALTRKIITFNLVALNLLIAGILSLDAGRAGLAVQRADALVAEAELIADVFEARLAAFAVVAEARGAPVAGGAIAGPAPRIDVAATLSGLEPRRGAELRIYDPSPKLLGTVAAQAAPAPTGLARLAEGLLSRKAAVSRAEVDRVIAATVAEGLSAGTRISTGREVDGSTIFIVAAPIRQDGRVHGAVVLVSAAGEIDALVWSERLRVLKIFAVATLVSVGLSLVLAATIARPISALADAAELGRDRARPESGRVRIPDLTARADEIGRLSGALRGMVTALYRRIETNEQFAADVAHEIKNPLASLRAAVGALAVARGADQRAELQRVIEHDVRRLDRLVSDISNASRLDSALVREAQKPFDLLAMLDPICVHLGDEARRKGVDFITDLPQGPVMVHGLEARLAQVFVNLIANATSFCEDGDAIRFWARKRHNRVLVVVEDTGPGIPEEALEKVFDRFYSHRPDGEFGNNSGLGLAISKQIVEAHGGVIWAENIRPTRADVTSEPHGARFVVGLPV